MCTDPSRAMVSEARANLAEHPNVTVAPTSGRELGEFADATFAVVFAQGVLGYLDPNPLLGLLDEVRRVLQPGGLCVFNFTTIDAADDGRYLLELARDHARRGRLSGDRAYCKLQIAAMYELVGLRAWAPADEPPAGRAIMVGERPLADSAMVASGRVGSAPYRDQDLGYSRPALGPMCSPTSGFGTR